MKKALMFASVASMIQQFNMENIRLLLDSGYAVDVACNMEQGSSITNEKISAMRQELEQMGVRVFHIPVPRKVTAVLEIMRSIQQSCALMNAHQYDLIHCHSPIGGMVCRVACRLSKIYKKAKVIYTAHGFHFYQGAPKKNWFLYYPVEWVCAWFTDVLITINREDYELAQKKMHSKAVKYVPGVGIDVKKFSGNQENTEEKRRELGIAQDAKIILSVGELNENKNHEVIVRALPRLTDLNVQYVIAGRGDHMEYLQNLAKELGVAAQLHLLGFRSDVAQLYAVADAFVFPSFREGLSVAMMEAMARGLPVVCSKIRGNTDLVSDGEGGFHVEPTDVTGFEKAISRVLMDGSLSKQMSDANKANIQKFSRASVNEIMRNIYMGASGV